MANLYEEWRIQSRGRPLKIAIAGQGGYGKSTLINNFLGLPIMEKARAGMIGRAVTETVRPYKKEVRGIKVVIFDTPGLCDPRIKNDQTLHDIGEVTGGKVDLLYYCVSLRIGRLTDGDVNAFGMLSKLFGKTLWENTVFVFTFANERCGDVGYPELIQNLTEEIWFSLEKAGVPRADVRAIAVTVAGKDNEPLVYCDNSQEDWKDKLFVQSLDMATPESAPALLQILMSDEELDMIFSRKKQADRETNWGRFGSLVGSAVGGVGGAIPGALAGVPGIVATGAAGGAAGGVTGYAVGKKLAYKEVKVEAIIDLKYKIWKKQNSSGLFWWY